MERPPVRKASRTLNLMKPAPRKNNLNSLNNNAEKAEEAIAEQENKPVGKRAIRGLKLEKPAPLKSSKRKKDETVFSDDSVPKNSRLSKPYDRTSTMDVQEQKCQERGQSQKASALPQNLAESKAAVLIKEALADMEELREKSRPQQVHHQTQLLSQVSDDSGVSDMSWYSRQESMLESLSENQDDLDWNDIDDSAETTFVLSSKHLACLPSALNQVQPFKNNLGEQAFENISTEDMNVRAKIKRGLRNSRLNNSSLRRSQHITRSYSVPSNFFSSNNNNNNCNVETECWDDEADFSIENKVNSVQSFSHAWRTSRISSFSSLNETAKAGTRIEERDETKAGNFIKGRGGCFTHNTVTVIPGSKHSTLDLSTGAEDWEADIVDVEITPTKPAHLNNSGKSFTDSAISNQCSDPDATPKSKFMITKYNDSAPRSTEKKLLTMEKSRKIQEGKQNCDKTIVNMKELPSYQNYKDKIDSDVSSCSSKILKDSEDYLSQETLEDFEEKSYACEFIEDLSKKVETMQLDSKTKAMGPKNFDDQSYARELIEDLSEKVDSKKLRPEEKDIGPKDKDMGPHDFLEKLALQEVMLPLDMDEIEAELEYMRGDLELSESSNSEKYVDPMFKSHKPECEKKVIITREPLHPSSSQEEKWLVEKGIPTGYSTAKGHDSMFRYQRQCSIDVRKEVTSERLLQYSPEELLLLGTREISKQKPETWTYLTKIYPNICLEQGSFFDIETYALERDYVVEVCNVVGGNFQRKQR